MARSFLSSFLTGTRVRIAYLRDGKRSEVSLTVDELDEKALAAASSETMEVLGVTVGVVSAEVREEFGLQPGEGVEVTGINRRSPLAAIIPPGVVVLSINGKKIGTPLDFAESMETATNRGIFHTFRSPLMQHTVDGLH